MSAKSEPPALPPGQRRGASPGSRSPGPGKEDARRRVEGRLAELGELVRRLAASARSPELVDYLDRIERSRRALDRMFRSHPLGNRERTTVVSDPVEGDADAREHPDGPPSGQTDES